MSRRKLVVVKTTAHRRDTNSRFSATLIYHVDDPYAVLVIFSSPGRMSIPWEFARSLLAAGMRPGSRAGRGDVVVAACLDEVVLHLRSPDGSATIAVPRQAVIKFLEASYRLVPGGQESGRLDLDTGLVKLLDQGVR